MSANRSTPETIFFIYADDDSDDHLLMSEACSRSNFKADMRSTFDGAELVELLSGDPQIDPDFIIVDMNMPKIDGLTAIRLLRGQFRFNRSPIFILSTNRAPEAFVHASDLGVSGCYTKPADLASLQAIINEIVSRSRSLKLQLSASEHS